MFGREPDFKNAFYSDLKYLYTFYVSFFFFFFPTSFQWGPRRLTPLGSWQIAGWNVISQGTPTPDAFRGLDKSSAGKSFYWGKLGGNIA